MDSISFAHHWLHLFESIWSGSSFWSELDLWSLVTRLWHTCALHTFPSKGDPLTIYFGPLLPSIAVIYSQHWGDIFTMYFEPLLPSIAAIYRQHWGNIGIYNIFWALVILNCSHIFTVAWPALINTPHTTVFKESAPESASESESESASYRQMYLLKFSNVFVEIAFSSPHYMDWKWTKSLEISAKHSLTHSKT